jgi:hypothetical protein
MVQYNEVLHYMCYSISYSMIQSDVNTYMGFYNYKVNISRKQIKEKKYCMSRNPQKLGLLHWPKRSTNSQLTGPQVHLRCAAFSFRADLSHGCRVCISGTPPSPVQGRSSGEILPPPAVPRYPPLRKRSVLFSWFDW